MKYCPECGEKIEEYFKYCPNCRTQIKTQEQEQTTTKEQTKEEKQNYKVNVNSLKKQIIIIGILGVILVGLGIYLMMEEENVYIYGGPALLIESATYQKLAILDNIYNLMSAARTTSIIIFIIGLILIGISINDYRKSKKIS